MGQFTEKAFVSLQNDLHWVGALLSTLNRILAVELSDKAPIFCITSTDFFQMSLNYWAMQ